MTGELQRIAPGDKRHFGTRIAFAGEQNEGESGGVSRVKPFQKGDEKGGGESSARGKKRPGSPELSPAALTSRRSCSTRGCSASSSGPGPAAPRSSRAARRPCSSAVLAPSSRHTATAVSERSRHSAEVAVPAEPLPPALIAPRSDPLGCRPPPAGGSSSARPAAEMGPAATERPLSSALAPPARVLNGGRGGWRLSPPRAGDGGMLRERPAAPPGGITRSRSHPRRPALPCPARRRPPAGSAPSPGRAVRGAGSSSRPGRPAPIPPAPRAAMAPPSGAPRGGRRHRDRARAARARAAASSCTLCFILSGGEPLKKSSSAPIQTLNTSRHG